MSIWRAKEELRKAIGEIGVVGVLDALQEVGRRGRHHVERFHRNFL